MSFDLATVDRTRLLYIKRVLREPELSRYS